MAHNPNKIEHSIPSDILDDLCSRFVINVPPEDRDNLVRICFQIELAHWFYLDFYCTDTANKLHPCRTRKFFALIFQHVPQLREHVKNLDTVVDNWQKYKKTVPTYGAILLDTELTHVLLVQSYLTKTSWSFPKGKVNEYEEPWICAAREVLEETGFDISRLINKNDYMEAVINKQMVRLYIICYIPRDFKFEPRTRNEIRACEWFPLADLPSFRKDMTPKLKMGVGPKAFYKILPFVKRMRQWVSERNPKSSARRQSMGDIEASTNETNPKSISLGQQNETQDYQQHNFNQKYTKNHHPGNVHSHGNHAGNGHYYGNNPSNDYGNVHNYDSATKNNQGSNRDKKSSTKLQLFTPQNTPSNFSPVHKEDSTQSNETIDESVFFNFVFPSRANFRSYGAILLDTELTHVLLVQSYSIMTPWGFPKGQVNVDEKPWICAAREVLQETGFDISRLINKNDYMEAVIDGQMVRLYIICYIPRDTKFEPRTRNEIRACEWFPLADLPSFRKDMTPKLKMGVGPKVFYKILPFVKRMRQWVSERNPKSSARRQSMGDIEASTNETNPKSISLGQQNETQDYQQHNFNQKYTKNHHPGNVHSHGNHAGNGHYYGNNPSNDYGNVHNYDSATKNNQGSNRDKKSSTKLQLFTPQNTPSNFSPVHKEDSTQSNETIDESVFFNFVFPSRANFRSYGAILLDTELTHVLLVQSYSIMTPWGFPKGQVNVDEKPWICAAREVLQETGFDISRLINKNDYMEAVIDGQMVRLYIICYIPRHTKFEPRTRNEIRAYEWFPLADLPLFKKDMTPKIKMGVRPKAFRKVLPFVKRIRQWVSERNPVCGSRQFMGDIEASTNETKPKSISLGLQNEIQDYQQHILNQKYTKNHHPGNHAGTGHYYGNNTSNDSGNVHNHDSATKNNQGSNRDKKFSTKLQLFSPQNTRPSNFSPVQKEDSTQSNETTDDSVFG